MGEARGERDERCFPIPPQISQKSMGCSDGPVSATPLLPTGLPVDLQYLPPDKQREPDADIRKMLIEAIMLVSWGCPPDAAPTNTCAVPDLHQLLPHS